MNPAQLVLRPAYSALRLPSRVLQTQVGSHLPQDGALRVGTDKLFGATDVLAGRLLGSTALVERGEAMQKHARTVTKAT